MIKNWAEMRYLGGCLVPLVTLAFNVDPASPLSTEEVTNRCKEKESACWHLLLMKDNNVRRCVELIASNVDDADRDRNIGAPGDFSCNGRWVHWFTALQSSRSRTSVAPAILSENSVCELI